MTKALIGIALVVVSIVAIGGFAIMSGTVDLNNFKQQRTVNTGMTPIDTLLPTDFQVYGKNFNVGSETADTLDISLTYGEDAEIDTICWDANGSNDTNQWTKIGKFTNTETGDANIDLDEGILDANGQIISNGTTEMWCEFSIQSGQDYMVDQEKIIRANDRIDTCIWNDANDDTDETWVCRYNLIGITGGNPDPNNEPTDVLQVYLFDEDTDGSIIDIVIESIVGVAQAETTTEITTHIDITNAADIVVISDIRVRNNLTSATDGIFKEGDSEICFEDSTARLTWYETRQPVGCLSLSNTSFFDFDQQTSTQEWLWSVDNYKDGILIEVPKNKSTQVDITFVFGTSFTAATDSICGELALKYIDATESKSSFDAQEFEVTAANINLNNCTIP